MSPRPSYTRRLGSSLAEISSERAASLVVATHSPEFLIGCLEAADTSVVRLTYEAEIATARTLSSFELASITQDPLLRSTGVLDALFHRAAVVTEASGDRAFYDEINHRLQSVDRGVRDAVFVNAQNKQTIRRLVGPLRRIGIPAVAVVDLDLIKDGGANWEDTLSACQVPQERRPELERERAYIANAFAGIPRGGKKQAIKSKGLRALRGRSLQRAQALLTELAEYGLFLVPIGEQDCWLRNLNATGHGSNWVIDVFSRIGHTPADTNYLAPGTDDVWEFLDNIAHWVDDTGRLGTG